VVVVVVIVSQIVWFGWGYAVMSLLLLLLSIGLLQLWRAWWIYISTQWTSRTALLRLKAVSQSQLLVKSQSCIQTKGQVQGRLSLSSDGDKCAVDNFCFFLEGVGFIQSLILSFNIQIWTGDSINSHPTTATLSTVISRPIVSPLWDCVYNLHLFSGGFARSVLCRQTHRVSAPGPRLETSVLQTPWPLCHTSPELWLFQWF